MDRVKNEVCEWTVTGMDCGSCANKVKTALDRLPGVQNVDVALMNERLRLTLDEAQTPRADIEKTIKKLGFGVHGADGPAQNIANNDEAAKDDAAAIPAPAPQAKWYQSPKGKLVVGTGLLLAVAWGVSLFTGSEIGHWAFVIACIAGLFPIARRALAMAQTGQFFLPSKC